MNDDQAQRHRLDQLEADHARAKATADRLAANHYRLLLGPAFFRRLHNTWTAL